MADHGQSVGWTSPDGREFGAVGQTDGTAFFEIKKEGKLEYLGRLPTQAETSLWRDMKVIYGYIYIGSEAAEHGLQVFDMRKVRQPRPERQKTAQSMADSKSPAAYTTEKDLTAFFSDFGCCCS
jgi:hypothetical protein